MKNQKWGLAPNVHHKSGSPTYAKKDEHGFTSFATLDMLKIKQLKTKQLAKHTDGITGVVAKVYLNPTTQEITLEYRFEGMDYAQVITTEQAIKYGIVELIENKELVKN